MAEPVFDLEGLMKLNYDYDLLKRVLEYLLSQDKAASGRLTHLEKLVSTMEKELADTKNDVAEYILDWNLD